MVSRLQFVKWLVVATYVCAAGRFVSDDPFGALNDMFGGIFGTFMLREDPVLQRCYSCLLESPLGLMSEGGMTCFWPYMFMSGLNGAFSAIRAYTILAKFGTPVPCSGILGCYLPVWLCISAAAQLVAVLFCWTVQRQQQDVGGAERRYGDAFQQGRQGGRDGREGREAAECGSEGRLLATPDSEAGSDRWRTVAPMP
uniref:Uncharacterized protein n=1 Tax=Zooxanthella nutricula TaxID=1333877 RepID=A0A7S2VKH7_9DINO